MAAILASISITGAFLLAAAIDVRERRIPNGIVLFVAVIAVIRLFILLIFGGGAMIALVDVVVAVLGFILLLPAFRFGIMGGGDVKLITAGILWFGAPGALSFVLGTVLSGGLLSLGLLALGSVRGRPVSGGVPYAVAIAAGAVATVYLSEPPNFPTYP